MSNSVVKVTELPTNEGIFVLKGKDGVIMPDRGTLESYLSGRKQETEINLICINESYGNNIEATMEPLIYDPNSTEDILEEIIPTEMDDSEKNLEQNLLYFRLDHDYTPLGSPKQMSPDHTSEEADELAHTLSILDGCSVSSPPPLLHKQSESLHEPKLVKSVSNITKPQNSTTQIQSVTKAKLKGPLEEKKPHGSDIVSKQHQAVKIFSRKSPKQAQIELENKSEDDSEEEDEDFAGESAESDENDSDFELHDSTKLKTSKRVRRTRQRKESSGIIEDAKHKSARRGRAKSPVKNLTSPGTSKESEQFKSIEKLTETVSEQKSLEKKPSKKEKKAPKPIPDDFALFSTPDIIRRVGSKQDNLPVTPTSLNAENTKVITSTPKPAKILPEFRAKSTSEQSSVEGKSKRLSTDTKTLLNEKERTTVKTKNDLYEKGKDRRMSLDVKSTHSSDRRLSLNIESKKPSAHVPTKPLVKSNPISVNRSNQVIIQSVEESAGSSSSENMSSQLETAIPSVEDIRAMIQNEDTKTYSNSLVIPDPSPQVPTQQPTVDQNTMNLEGSGLDIDPLLDNINSDLISEDILYQVAQSLADNTELQNAIDKSLTEESLVLDPNVQQAISQSQQGIISQEDSSQQKHANTLKSSGISSTTKGTQIVRPDGRIVIIPPIERPTTRSRNRQPQKSPETPKSTSKFIHKPLYEEHVSGNELDDLNDEEREVEEEEEEEEDDRSDDDPDKLWCICNQPHNNRFMICCDQCEEWYHGKCVNVTKAMGQLMEQEGREWICVYCKDPSLKRPAAAARRVRKASKASTDSGKSQSRSSSSLTESGNSSSPDCIVCGKPSRTNSIFCSDQCILKQAQTVERVVVFERASGRILSGSNAPSAANLEKWLKEHPGFEVVRSTSKPIVNKGLSQSKLKLVRNQYNEGVSLAIQRKGLNVGVLQHSPKNQQAQQHLQNKNVAKSSIPHFKIIRKQKPLTEPRTKLIQPPHMTTVATPTKAKLIQTVVKPTTSPSPNVSTTSSGTSTPSTSTAVAKEKAKIPKTIRPKQHDDQATSIAPPPRQSENIRENVKKTVFEQLTNRLKLANDLKLEPDEVVKISNEIESQLYKCFGDTGQKYRNKYRSLIFNIKDIKNQTLWRRICEKSINPYQLVRLSPDDLASQELALWRERENKHQLDMIKKSELELLNCNRQYVLKTHKGEQVLEDNRAKDGIDSTEVIASLNSDNISGSESLDSKKDSKEKDKKSSKYNKYEKDKERGRDRRNRSREKSDSKERKKDERRKEYKRRSRSRSRSKSRDRHGEKKKTSRDRDRHHRSSYKSSRHKKESTTTEKLDKKSKEILEQLVDKQIVPPLEDRLWKHVPQEDITTPAIAESDSDHEPSSTVTIPTPPRTVDVEESPSAPPSVKEKTTVDKVEKTTTAKVVSPPTTNDDRSMSPPPKTASEYLWKGTINMVDVAQISITAHEVSGDCSGLANALPPALDVIGRISPETVWEYIGKMKCSNSKTISLIRLNATNMEEKMPYIALYSYLSSRNRLGVVKSSNKAVKDFYILPLASQKPIPQALLPINGPGFEESRPALLLGIIVRDKRKRPIFDPFPSVPKRTKIEVSVVVTPSVTTPVTTQARSYTPPPPLSRDPRIKVGSTLSDVPKDSIDDMDEPYSPEDSDPDTIVSPPHLDMSLDSTSVVPETSIVKPSPYIEPTPTIQPFEPFSNKFDTIPGLEESSVLPASSQELQKKMAELDQKIAMQKAEIDNMSQNIVSTATADIGSSSLANIALPSNLQQILDSIKGIGASSANTDNTSAPSVTETSSNKSSDLTIPLLLPKISSRSTPSVPVMTNVNTVKKDVPSSVLSPTIPLNLPKPKIKPSSISSSLLDKNTPSLSKLDTEKSGSVLSSLSEEDLIRKAAEMLGEKNNDVKSKTAIQVGVSSSEGYTVAKTGYQTATRAPPPPYSSGPIIYTPPSIPNLNVLPPNILPSNLVPPAKRSKVDDQPPVPGLEDEM